MCARRGFAEESATVTRKVCVCREGGEGSARAKEEPQQTLRLFRLQRNHAFEVRLQLGDAINVPRDLRRINTDPMRAARVRSRMVQKRRRIVIGLFCLIRGDRPDLNSVASELNARPRQTLQWMKPCEIFDAVASTA